jgi:zinc transporter 1/2/3
VSVPIDPQSVNLTALGSEALREITCWVQSNENDDEDKDEGLNVKIAAIFMVAVVSTAVTMFPTWLKGWQSSKLGAAFYNFARCFGSGIILATAIIQFVLTSQYIFDGQVLK